MRNIALVGSRATGEARPDSDWDFRVETCDFGALADSRDRAGADARRACRFADRLRR